MSIREKANRISEICDGALSHPNLYEVENDPTASAEDLRYVIENLTKNLKDIWDLAGEIYTDAPNERTVRRRGKGPDRKVRHEGKGATGPNSIRPDWPGF